MKCQQKSLVGFTMISQPDVAFVFDHSSYQLKPLIIGIVDTEFYQ